MQADTTDSDVESISSHWKSVIEGNISGLLLQPSVRLVALPPVVPFFLCPLLIHEESPSPQQLSQDCEVSLAS
jgi:hypothetical protein